MRPIVALCAAAGIGKRYIALLCAIWRKRTVFKDVRCHAVRLKNIGLFDYFLFACVIHFYLIQPYSRIKHCVFRICPKRQDFIAGKQFKSQLPRSIVIRVQPAYTAVEAFKNSILYRPHETCAQHLFKRGKVRFVFACERYRLANYVILFNIGMLCILVINNLVIRQIINRYKLAVFAYACTLSA